MLIQIYIFALIVGAIVLASSIFLGGDHHGDADLDAHAELDLDVNEVSGDAAIEGDQDVGSIAGFGVFVGSFLSLRFWSFFSMFFGLTGACLHGLGLGGPNFGLVLATVTGLITGQAAVWTIRYLANNETGTHVSDADYIGKSGRVLLSISPQASGKIRLNMRGTTVDILAKTTDERPFAVGDSALVIELDGPVAVVSRAQNIASSTPL